MKDSDNVNDKLLSALLQRDEAHRQYLVACEQHESGSIPLDDVDRLLRAYVHATAAYHAARRESIRWSDE